jgi:hypothetical protein
MLSHRLTVIASQIDTMGCEVVSRIKALIASS